MKKITYLFLACFVILLSFNSYNVMSISYSLNNCVDYELFNKSQKNANFMFSPFSIRSIFMLLANGSKGDSLQEISKFFRISDINQSNLGMKETMNAFNSEGIVKVYNSVWLNKDYVPGCDIGFNQGYLKVIKDGFSAEAYDVRSDNAVEDINSWVKSKTNGKILSVVNRPDFLSIVINAIYFKSSWENPFSNLCTHKGDFINIDGEIDQVDFMYKNDRFNYYEDDKIQTIEMKYKNSSMSMYVIIPKDNICKNLINSELIDNISKLIKEESVRVQIPKFKVETSLSLKDTMMSFGIKQIFNPLCTDLIGKMFYNSDGSNNVYISDIVHKTFIEVDEGGTEAAAVTAAIAKMNMIGPTSRIYEFNANKPFIYIIKDNKNGNILFMGKQLKF